MWQTLALGYLIVILTGSVLLILPFATAEGEHTDYLGALFTFKRVLVGQYEAHAIRDGSALVKVRSDSHFAAHPVRRLGLYDLCFQLVFDFQAGNGA